jgi:hypothetical protein
LPLRLGSIAVCAAFAVAGGCGGADRVDLGHSPAAHGPGAGSGRAAGSPHAVERHGKNDGDRDWDRNDDDADVRDYGHPARSVDRRAIVALVDRYYAAAAATDGHEACSLLRASVAEGLAAGADAGPSGSSSTAQRACALTVSKLFRYAAGRSGGGAGRVRTVAVRSVGSHGLAIVRLPSGEERYMPVVREHRVWKVGAPLDSGMI